MNRSIISQMTHNARSFLNLGNSEYKQWVFRYTFLELDKDLGPLGDISTAATGLVGKGVKAQIVAKEDGIFAGGEEIQYFLVDGDKKFRPRVQGDFVLEFVVKDGGEFKKGDVLVEISANAGDLLAVERVMLNLLMRMSGVATYTAKMLGLVAGLEVLVAPTRKTLWGLLDKKAVSVGGGGTHRLNLADAVLLKDTHLDLFDRDVRTLLEKVLESNDLGRFLEVEVETVEEAMTAATVLNENIGKKSSFAVGAILLDNMSAEEVKSVIAQAKEAGMHENLLFEASGGIKEDNVLEYAKTGVDIVSMGSLTNGPRSLDMSLKIV